MTKQDHQLIANVLRIQLEAIGSESKSSHRFVLTGQIAEISAKFANVLIQDNPGFDTDKFMNAIVPRVVVMKRYED